MIKETKGLSQQIIEFFEKHPKEILSEQEIVQILDATARLVRDKLNRLIKHNEISFEKISWRVARKIYGNNNLKKGIRLYYLLD